MKTHWALHDIPYNSYANLLDIVLVWGNKLQLTQLIKI